ncbi:potassium channel family protein [Streptomyces sp. NPDC058812]|uniref:potassium channel family protein n=1 Tax=unclassified Streptomyces TaxID=2593676 RepID=UPI0036A486C0
MGWIVTVTGTAVILAVLRDVFHTLWHPTGRGDTTTWITAAVWHLARRIDSKGRVAAVAGPLALVAVAALWTVMIAVGWALVYWPHLPGGFSYAEGLEPPQRAGFLDALYLSLVTLATLGFGDIVPEDGWLRIAAPVQALIGFALLTAVVSWVSQVYPALTRRRALALRLATLRGAGHHANRLGPSLTAGLLADLAADVIQARVDMTQHAETYYFHDGEDDSALAAMAGYAAELALKGQTSAHAEVRTSAAMLGRALEDFAKVLNRQFLHRDDDSALEVLRAYAADHGRVGPSTVVQRRT